MAPPLDTPLVGCTVKRMHGCMTSGPGQMWDGANALTVSAPSHFQPKFTLENECS
jgi:hypothetical protein